MKKKKITDFDCSKDNNTTEYATMSDGDIINNLLSQENILREVTLRVKKDKCPQDNSSNQTK